MASSPDSRPLSHDSRFFQYHGAWAPGVRLFRSLRFGPKAALISLAFLLPLLLLAAAYWRNAQATLEVSRHERAGVALMQALEPWLIEVQKQRRLVLSGLSAAPDMDAIAKQRAALAQLIQSQPGGLDLAGELAALAPAHEALARARGEPAALAAPLQDYVEAIRGLRRLILDRSELTLDRDQDSHYVMLVATEISSDVIESVSRSRALAGAAAREGRGDGATLRELYAVWHQGYGKLQLIDTAAQRATAANPELQQRLGTAEALRVTRAFYDAAAQAWFGDSFAAEVQKLGQPGQAAVDSLRALSQDATRLLDELLQARIERTESARDWAFGAVLLGLLIAGYLFHSFYLVMDGGLREVARHLDAMSEGDLTTTPHPWGRDEAAELMHVMARMQESLRRMVLNVGGSAEDIAHASDEIASGAMDLSSRTEQTAANLQQSAAAMEQISATVQQTAQHTQSATAGASENARFAQRGGEVMTQMVGTMEEIQQSSHRIADIIGVIDGIAFQTNILALNAAVEAARAGEQGRGFAVVAGEVRQLAQRSAEAAKEIKALIQSSVARIGGGTEVAREAGATMEEIVSSAAQVNGLLGQIATASREQSQGLGQVRESVQELDRVTQQNAAMVEQTAAGAAALRDLARALNEQVARFKLPPQARAAMAKQRSAQMSATAPQDLDIDAAIDAHRQWKVRLRAALENRLQLNAEQIACDDACVLGQWIYGRDGQRMSSAPGFVTLLEQHQAFHRAAGEVARRINAGQMGDAQRLLGSGSEFASASNGVALALTRLKRGR